MNKTWKASDKLLETAGRGECTPSHSAAGPRHPISITATQIEYDQNKDRGKIWPAKESQNRKGPDKTLEVEFALNHAPLPSVAGPSCPIPVSTAGSSYEQRKEEGDSEGHSKSAREVYSNAWTPEMIELVIQKLDEIMGMSQTHTQLLLLCGHTCSMRFLHCHTNVTLHYGFQYKKSHVMEIITGLIIYSKTWVRHFTLMTGTKCMWQCDGNTQSL